MERFGVAPVEDAATTRNGPPTDYEYPMPNTQQALTLSLVRDTGLIQKTLSFISATEAQLSSVLIGLLDRSDDCVKVLSLMVAEVRELQRPRGYAGRQLAVGHDQFWWDLWPESARGDCARVCAYRRVRQECPVRWILSNGPQ